MYLYCTFKEKDLTDLAGNMVSTPLFLAMAQCTMASVSWRPTDPDWVNQEGKAPRQPHDGDSNGDDALDDGLFQHLLDLVPDEEPPLGEAGMAAAGVNDGLLHGPTGPAAVETRGIKRRGGLLMQAFGELQKTNDGPRP